MCIVQILKVLRKFTLGFALTALLVVLVVQTYQILAKYFSYPTFVSTKIVDQKEAEFPAATFCPIESSYKTDVLQV